MNKIILNDKQGKKYQATIIFNNYCKENNKNYIVYLIDKDLLAASLELKNEQYIIDNNLSNKEFDMLDKLITKKMRNYNA